MTFSNSVMFCSDLHLGHRLVAEKRGFVDVDSHDNYIVNKLKEQCNKRTILWILGDVCMDINKMELLTSILGRKRLIRGNHDKFDLGVYLKYFEEIHGFLHYKEMWLSHCPIHPQEMYRCKLNVHGHIHKNTNSLLLDFPYFNLNWDFWGRAVSLDEIKQYRDLEHNTTFLIKFNNKTYYSYEGFEDD